MIFLTYGLFCVVYFPCFARETDPYFYKPLKAIGGFANHCPLATKVFDSCLVLLLQSE